MNENKIFLNEKFMKKLKNWLEYKYNLYFLGVLFFTIGIRLYYFFMTYNQPLWWDEAEYMAFAKNLAFGNYYELGSQRLILFPFLASLFLRIGFGEIGVRFFLILIPSILIVFITYYFVKSMYDEKTALITSFLSSVLWIHIFYTMRIMNDELSFLFGLISLFLFWEGYILKKNYTLVYLSSFFMTLSFLLRPAGIYYGVVLILFLFITENFKFLTNKKLWYLPMIFILTVIPYLLWSYFYHGNAFAFRTAFGGPSLKTFGWNILKFIPIYTEIVWFLFFIIGLFTLFPLIFTFDKTLKGDKRYNNDLFMLTLFLFVLGISIFLIRQVEDRWLMAFSLPIFVFTSKGILLVFKLTKKYFNKNFAIILVIFILGMGCFFQLKHSDKIIKDRLNSYSQIRDSGLWIKENTYKEDVVFSKSNPQISYYSERKVISFFTDYPTTEKNETDLINVLKQNKVKYFMLSSFEPHENWILKIPEKYPNLFIPVQAYEMNGQTVVAIYEIDYNKF